jgi:peptidoglycan hydrolase CwlO-like protein
MSAEHICPHEEVFQEYGKKIAELEAHVNYKDKRIDELIKDQKKMEDKIDKIDDKLDTIMIKSVQGDNDNDKRLTSLETTVKVLKWCVSILFGSGLVWVILNFAR